MVRLLYFASSRGIGLTTHLTEYAIGLKNQRVNIIVVHNGVEQEKDLISELNKYNVKNVVIRSLESLNPISFFINIIKLSKIINNNNINIIHCQGIYHLIMSYFAKKISKRKPKVVTQVHSYYYRSKNYRLFLFFATTIMNLLSDVILSVSKQTKYVLVRHGLKLDKLTIIYNALNIKKIKYYLCNESEEFKNIITAIKDRKVIIYAAKLTYGKGHDTLLFAAKKVVEFFPDVLFVLAGDGELKNELIKLTKKLNIKNNVIFTGRLKYQSLIKLMKHSYIGVIPSYAETFCHALIEPMAVGKPVISTPVGVAEEVISNGKTGYLVSIKNSDELAEKIIYLLDTPSLVRKMGKNAKNLIEKKFTIKEISRNLIKIYKSIKS